MENDNASQISGCEILQIQASELLSSFHPQYSVSEGKLPMKHMSQTSKESDSTKIIYAKLKRYGNHQKSQAQPEDDPLASPSLMARIGIHRIEVTLFAQFGNSILPAWSPNCSKFLSTAKEPSF